MSMQRKIQQYVKTWEQRCYHEGIPDEAPQEIDDMAPSYRRIVLAILKNDVTLKTLGLAQPKCAAYDLLKRIEISKR